MWTKAVNTHRHSNNLKLILHWQMWLAWISYDIAMNFMRIVRMKKTRILTGINSMRKLHATLIWFSCEYYTIQISQNIHAKLFILCFIVVSCEYHANIVLLSYKILCSLIIFKSSTISFYLNLRIKSHIEKKAEVLIGMLDEELT